MPQPNTPFSNASALRDYAEKTARIVPGLHDLLKMAALLVAERAPESANVLVIGAGGGMELAALAEAHPHWQQFVGVDPSQPMLDLAAAALGPLVARARLHLGYSPASAISGK